MAVLTFKQTVNIQVSQCPLLLYMDTIIFCYLKSPFAPLIINPNDLDLSNF